uniref:NADH dehydrogenase subunit 2 n=1 Tax=Priotyrannus closteroides TaxID=584594 RepID=UPI002000E285|nr:NADH dehydrogenase subunit 2 [Priotyrannus closteroides]UNZ12704.1 NADH dehydrogenase subunit 2 [Priotyrannus closteroides]
MKSYKILFFTMMISGTLISVSSYSWMSMWIGLEINLLSIIPLLSEGKNFYPSESALKYFITQALASTILLFSIVMSFNLKEFLPTESNNISEMIMNSALLTKLGAAPFHAWFPEVMEGLNWTNCMILLTWQKLAPMILLMYNPKMTTFLTSIIILSAAIGGILGLNQVSMRKILAYSSINHIAWMISSTLNSQSIWLIYFTVYSIITINIVLILRVFNIFFIKQMLSLMNQTKTTKFLFMMNFLSLGGLPPFLGFFPKWLTINNLVQSSFNSLSVVLIVTTLITLFFYLRITFSALVINTNETLVQQNPNNPNTIMLINLISLASLILCPLTLSSL